MDTQSGITSPKISRVLMIATYAIGGVGLFVAFSAMSSGDRAKSAEWAAVVAVGGSGLLSFVRHSIFHRSDAARMNWDYGRRNDFQIEVGFANLAIGISGVLSWLLDWGIRAQGAVVITYGIYLLAAALLHGSELARPRHEGGGRYAPAVAAFAFAGALLASGIYIVSG